MDAVEAFSIIDLAVGDGFCILLSKDGRMISWGQNSFGQLGCGDRDFKEKPKPNNFSAELRLLKVCAGSQHVLALARNGQVLTWGANRYCFDIYYCIPTNMKMKVLLYTSIPNCLGKVSWAMDKYPAAVHLQLSAHCCTVQ